MSARLDPCWQKARIAARILVRERQGRLMRRDRRLAGWLAEQPGVSNRLIEQGIASVLAEKKKRNHGVADITLAAAD